MTIFRLEPPNWDKNRIFRPLSDGFDIDQCWTVACRQHFDGGVGVIALVRCQSPAINT